MNTATPHPRCLALAAALIAGVAFAQSESELAGVNAYRTTPQTCEGERMPAGRVSSRPPRRWRERR